MQKNTRVWVLGASDPEMVAIERLLLDAGERVVYATDDGYVRVAPAKAYSATRLSRVVDIGSETTLVLVECAPTPGSEFGHLCQMAYDVTRIDHHREGDPGYGLGPERYWDGSSIGQVASLLELNAETLQHWPPMRPCCGVGWDTYGCPDCHQHEGQYEVYAVAWRRWNLIAAADHCLESAYRGRCPGVSPDALMRWRIEYVAAFTGESVKVITEQIEAAREALRTAERLQVAIGPAGGNDMDYEHVADLREQRVPQLPEAACREGVPYLATVSDRDGRQKVVLGAASPSVVEAFMRGHLVSGLTGVYGVPSRGYAGGYLVE